MKVLSIGPNYQIVRGTQAAKPFTAAFKGTSVEIPTPEDILESFDVRALNHGDLKLKPIELANAIIDGLQVKDIMKVTDTIAAVKGLKQRPQLTAGRTIPGLLEHNDWLEVNLSGRIMKSPTSHENDRLTYAQQFVQMCDKIKRAASTIKDKSEKAELNQLRERYLQEAQACDPGSTMTIDAKTLVALLSKK